MNEHAVVCSGAFYAEVVRLLVAGRPRAAALLGWGSDVLGYDTELEDLSSHLDEQLPSRFRGWPMRYGWDDIAPTHHVTVTTLSAWLVDWLGVDATTDLSLLDWPLTPQQRLLGVVRMSRVPWNFGGGPVSIRLR